MKSLVKNYVSSAKEANQLESALHRSYMEAQRANPKMNPYSRTTWDRRGRSSGGDHNQVPHFGTIYSRRYVK
jgi:hypothetical protein